MVITMGIGYIVWSLQCIEMVIGYLHCLYSEVFSPYVHL